MLLTDDDKALLVLEHLGPAALAGDKMSLYDCFHLALDVAEKSLLAKLASAEFPPLPAYECGPHTGHAAVRTDESIEAYGRQAYAQGSASQLAEKPCAWFVIRSNPGCRDDGLRYGPFWKLADAEELQDSRHSVVELYTRKEAK
jgi:hypothetical protein